MQKITLYKYARADGGTTVSLNKPEGEYTEMYRLVADEGKALTDGNIIAPCIDIEIKDSDKWSEIDAPEEDTEEELPEGHISDTEALKIITGEIE